MTIDEQARHQLFERLDEVLGRDHSATLMSCLPPAGWAEVATKQDVGAVRNELALLRADMDQRFAALDERTDPRFAGVEARFDGVEARFDGVEGRFEGVDARFDALDYRFEAMEHRIVGAVHKTSRDHLLAMVWANIGQLVALGGLLLAAVRL
jgi:hypothetical protein